MKVIGANGQISLGKKYAGRHVLVEERKPGAWFISTATVVPDNESWLSEEALKDVYEALAWAKKNPPRETDLVALEKMLNEAD